MEQITYFNESGTQIEEDAPEIVRESWRKARIDMKKMGRK